MNPELFTAFLLITFVLIIAPGPIVTLVISTGATRGVRAALTTVAGTTLGNALLLAAIALGLNWVHAHADLLFTALRWTGAAYLIWLGVQAWRHAGEGGDADPRDGPHPFRSRPACRAVQSEDDRFLHRLPAAVHRSAAAGGTAACRDVRRLGADRRRLGLRLGGGGRHGARLVPEAGPCQIARPALGNSPHRRGFVAVARQTDELSRHSGSHALENAKPDDDHFGRGRLVRRLFR